MPSRDRAAVWSILATLLATQAAGCAPVGVVELRPAALNRAARSVLEYRSSTDAPIAETAPERPAAPDPALIAALESLDAARRDRWLSPDRALARCLESLATSWTVLNAPGGDEPGDAAGPALAHARSVYNQSLAEFLRLAGGRRFRLDGAWREDLARRGISIEVVGRGAVGSPEKFDEFRFAGDFTTIGTDHRHRSDGLGVPLLACRRSRPEELSRRHGEERFYPFWEVYPTTAALRFDRRGSGSGRIVLELHDTLTTDHTAVGGRELALASDLTTATAFHFAHSRLQRYERIGMFAPERMVSESGLYLLHPYEPGKIPVVMVHGLLSSPLAWARVVDELRGDPALRSRYQFWMYMYPTGNPLILSAADLRRALDDVRQSVDPERRDTAFDRMVLIGHSMGGLISRMLISESNDDVWRVYGERPFDQLVVGPEHRELLNRVMFFHPVPSVRRVVYIATPHHGARMGGSIIGRVGDRLIRLPSPLKETHQAMLQANGPEAFTAWFRNGLPSSLDELAPDNPLLSTLGRLPIAPEVPYHTIVGQWRPGAPETGSDGVVPYSSSHLDGAESELVVRKFHECQDDTRTIEELRRILRVHLDAQAWVGG